MGKKKKKKPCHWCEFRGMDECECQVCGCCQDAKLYTKVIRGQLKCARDDRKWLRKEHNKLLKRIKKLEKSDE